MFHMKLLPFKLTMPINKAVLTLPVVMNSVISLWILSAILLTTPAKARMKTEIPIGMISSKAPDWQDVFAAMKFAIEQHQNNNATNDFTMKFSVDNINTVDAYKLTKIICRQFERGAFALMGAVDPESFDTLHSFSNAFAMPFVTPWFPEKNTEKEDGTVNFAVQIQPEYHEAIVDLISYYNWNSIIYIYHSFDGLHRLQKMYENIPQNSHGLHTFYVETVKKIVTSDDAIAFLKQLERMDRESVKHIVLDCPAGMAKEILIKHVQTIVLGRRNYHYLMSGLVLDENWDETQQEYGAINVTGLRMVEYDSSFSKDFFRRWKSQQRRSRGAATNEAISGIGALAYDTVSVLAATFNTILEQNPNEFLQMGRRPKSKGLECGDMTAQAKPVGWSHGHSILSQLKKTTFKGLTGHIAFNSEGKRTNYSLSVMEMTPSSHLVKMGTWSDQLGLNIKSNPLLRRGRPPKLQILSKTYIMTTILEEPYMRMKKAPNGVKLEGNERYEGYCKDLADLISKKTGLKFYIKPVKDGKYGGPDPNVPGGFNGMIGELTRREADIAIAPLTINSQREQMADFSKPFMSIGISIMIKLPVKQRPGVFTFTNPLSMEIWMCVVFAYIGVSIVLFLVSRFSPYEWKIEESMAGTTVSNHFSVINSLWFALGAFMQQGIDITPRSISGRIVGGVWWFFSLILISSYTANLAAFLTVERMVVPIKGADDLAAQTEIEYGAVRGGSTTQFLQNSKLDTYSKMWAFMSSRDYVLTNSTKEGIKRVRESKGKYAFLIESSGNEYTNENEPCDTMKVGKNLDAKGYGIATAKGTGLKEVINLAVLNLTENGELAELKNKWWYLDSKCHKENETQRNELSLMHVAGIFFILIGGLILAMVTALIEFCYKASVESKKAKVPMADAMKNKARLALSGGRDIDNIRFYGDSSAL